MSKEQYLLDKLQELMYIKDEGMELWFDLEDCLTKLGWCNTLLKELDMCEDEEESIARIIKLKATLRIAWEEIYRHVYALEGVLSGNNWRNK